MNERRIKKVLIANRGEIACRVQQTCREMGIATVAVYSDADRTALFVQQADEAFRLGEALASDSYLNIAKIIAVAKDCGADAIHPGYGFLSENAAFSKSCAEAGIVFLGPKPDAITAMGDKVTARTYAEKAGVPMVPGTLDPIDDIKKIKKLAEEFGYPVLIKAAAGGGGKGMRVVRDASDIEGAFRQATSEAEKSFGDGRVYLEKYVEEPRHVEVQLARDTKGNALFLLERECSMQRRHQKVIEEAPCSYLKEDARQKMASDALRLADAIDYHGVGTVEFLVDADQNHYFLEMNTRLQVEHPVTEMITGIDLVRCQLIIGEGKALPYQQEDIVARGHAIECRIYAEDPQNGFMPSPGIVRHLRVPEGRGIRHDTGVRAGSEISIHYDPMIAKLVVHDESREMAIDKMHKALTQYQIGGLKNNVWYLKKLLLTNEFKSATMHTQFIDTHPELATPEPSRLPLAVILAAAVCEATQSKEESNQQSQSSQSPWFAQGLADQLKQRF